MPRTGRPRTAEWTWRICKCGCGTEFETPPWDARKYVSQDHYFAAKAANKKPQPERTAKVERVCSYVDADGVACVRPYKGRGYCDTHLRRIQKHGDVNVVLRRGKSVTGPGACPVVEDGKICGKPIDSKSLCHNHYMRHYRRGGDPGVKLSRGNFSTPVSTRTDKWEKRADGCLIWIGARNKKGYGHVGLHGETRLAHRAMYEELVGPIPAGMTLDHLCAEPACGNVDHLDPCTESENLSRGGLPHFELRGTVKKDRKVVKVNIGTTAL